MLVEGHKILPSSVTKEKTSTDYIFKDCGQPLILPTRDSKPKEIKMNELVNKNGDDVL
jgi:hypothetical protein